MRLPDGLRPRDAIGSNLSRCEVLKMRKSADWIPMWIPALLLATGCGGEAGGAAEWAGTVDDSAGVQLVYNTPQPLWGSEDAWSVEDVLTIGEAAGDPDYQFGQISGVGLTSDGRILVIDQQAQHVKVFQPDGTIERTIGRAGSGPGEFGQGVGPVLVGRGDTVIVPDLGNQRVNVFLPDGSEPASFPMSFDQGFPARWDMTDSGDLVYQLRALNLPNTDQRETLDLIAAVSYRGELLDTLMTPARGQTLTFSDDGRPQRRIFSPEPSWTLLGADRICLAVNDRYRIGVYDLEGTLRRVISIPQEPAPITDDDRRIFWEMVENLWDQLQVPEQQREIGRQTVSLADDFPAFLQLMNGPRGTLWVQHVLEPSALTEEEQAAWNPLLDFGADEWDVFDEDGRYLGVVEMPHRYQPILFDDDQVYGIWRDEFDVQYVRVMEITGLESAAA
jgi:hypothetical protein